MEQFDAALLSAAIAATVSVLVALISVLANRTTLKAEREKLETELQRQMTAKLYDLRLESYPRAIEITERLRKSRMALQGPDISEDYFRSILQEIDEWNSTKAGFLLSENALQELYGLRAALRVEPAADGLYSSEQIAQMHLAKGRFRRALRADVQLLYAEESQEESQQPQD